MSRDVTPIDREQRETRKKAATGDKGQIIFEGKADSSTCYIGKITGVRNLDAWIFDIECDGDGEIRRDRTIVMHTTVPEGIAAYNLGADLFGGVTQLYRCYSEGDGFATVDQG
jgi:hypothetical protein